MKNGQENGILIQVWDQTKIVPRKPQNTSDKLQLFPDYEVIIEIDNDKRGVIGDFTTSSNIGITKAEPE